MDTTIPNSDTTNQMVASSWWQRHGRQFSLFVRLGSIIFVVIGVVWWYFFTPVLVISHPMATGIVSAEVMGTGTLEARTSAIVGSKIGGLIVRITADQGDRVKAGSLLFQLEDSEFKQQIKMAESEIAAAMATIVRLGANRHRAEAVIVLARTNHKRVGELVLSKVVPQQDFDNSFEALSIAEAELATADAAIIEGEKRLDVAKRYLEFQQTRLHDTTIESPFDAMVVRRDRETGDVVTAGSSVLQLVSTNQMWIKTWVDETELARLAEGQKARVVFRSEPGVEYQGVVARVGREADRETREIVVDVSVEKQPINWAVGQRAEAYIQVDRRDTVMTIPSWMLLVRNGKTGVFVYDDGKAKWREIALGLSGRENVEVTSGLSLGDIVVSLVTKSSESLKDGRRIKLK
jgi:HlyD family secretion protein